MNFNDLPISPKAYQHKRQFHQALQQAKLSKDDVRIRKVLLEQFEDILPKDSTDKIYSLLGRLEESNVSDERFNQFFSAIKEIEPSAKTKIPESIKIEDARPSPLLVFFDIYAIDHNAAIKQRAEKALFAGLPVITTRSTFNGTNLDFQSRPDLLFQSGPDAQFSKILENYNIFSNGPYLVFIPKPSSLQALDLDPNQCRKIPFQEAFQITDDEPTLENYQSLFISNPQHKKLIEVMGHGTVGNPCGLSTEQFSRFIEWSKKQNCVGLILLSCYAGGQSSLLFQPKERDPSKYEETPPQSVDFPIILRAIGDFAVSDEGGVSKEFFEELIDLWNTPGGRTRQKLARLIQKEEGKNPFEKSTINYMQVMFTTQGDAPHGFRPLAEREKTATLTQLQATSPQRKPIEVKDAKVLELTAPIVSSRVTFLGSDPVIMSMMPGNAHHIISHLIVNNSSKEWFAALLKQYEGIETKKAFFIGTLESGPERLEQVFIDITRGIMGYKIRERYEFLNGTGTIQEVSPLTFHLEARRVFHETTPSNQAILAQSAGMVSSQEMKSVFETIFSKGNPLPQVQVLQKEEQVQDPNLSKEDNYQFMNYFILIFEAIFSTRSPLPQALQTVDQIRDLNLSKKDSNQLMHYLIHTNPNLLILCLDAGIADPNSSDFQGVTLLQMAVTLQNENVVRALLKKNASPFAQTLGKDPVILALNGKSLSIADQFLALPDLLTMTTTVGNPLYVHTIEKPDVLEHVMSRFPYLDWNIPIKTGKKEFHILRNPIQNGDLKGLKLLLDKGVDPNKILGEFPLTTAIQMGKQEAISLLLAYGADPYLGTEVKTPPVIVAMRSQPLKVVEKLLQKPMDHLKPGDKERLVRELFLSAVSTGDENKIKFALKLNPNTSFYTRNPLDMLVFLQRWDLIELLKSKSFLSRSFEKMIIEALLRHPDQIADHFSLFNEISPALEIVLDSELPTEQKKEIVSKALKAGYDLKTPYKAYHQFAFMLDLFPKEPNQTLLNLAEDRGLTEIAELLRNYP